MTWSLFLPMASLARWKGSRKRARGLLASWSGQCPCSVLVVQAAGDEVAQVEGGGSVLTLLARGEALAASMSDYLIT